MDELVGRSIIVSGRVQGVFYRKSTMDEACKLGVKGWVKNLPDGNVQIQAFGSGFLVEKLIAWCQQGPPMAVVTEIVVDEISFREESDFKVVY